MEIISWNVNSIRSRLPRVAALLARRQPDLVCLQEIKVSPQDFPVAEFAALGYASAVHGQEGRNGVAMLARAAPADVACGFDADPAPGQARVLSATVAGMRVMSVYVVNGQAVGTPDYALKLRWLSAFTSWLGSTQRPGDPLLLVGDFNIAPDDRDLYDPDGWRGRNLCSDPERERLATLLSWGLTDLDLTRARNPGPGPLHVLGLPAGRLPRLGPADRPGSRRRAGRRALYRRSGRSGRAEADRGRGQAERPRAADHHSGTGLNLTAAKRGKRGHRPGSWKGSWNGWPRAVAAEQRGLSRDRCRPSAIS